MIKAPDKAAFDYINKLLNPLRLFEWVAGSGSKGLSLAMLMDANCQRRACMNPIL